MLKALKDKALSKAIETAINLKIKEFGKMLKLNLNSLKKTIELELMLKGEINSSIISWSLFCFIIPYKHPQ